MKTSGLWLLLVVALGATGCLKIKEEITVREDGSGTVTLEVRTAMPAEMMTGGMGMMGGGGSVLFPPLNKAMVEALFPTKDFTVSVTEPPPAVGAQERTLSVAVQFKDINALLNSPYGKAHALTLTIAEGQLRFKALSGMALTAMMAENKDMLRGGGMAGLGQMGVKPEDLRVEFKITLPHAVAASNGQRAGATATWLVERAKLKDATEAARQLSSVMEASCPAEGLKFVPVTPARLMLTTFQEVKEGSVGPQAAAPDAPKVQAAAKFVPQSLQTSRSIDLTGESGQRQQNATLNGLLTIPREFAPDKVGSVTLTEVTDSTGKSLKPDKAEDEDGDEGRFSRHMSQVMPYAEVAEDDDDAAKPKAPAMQRYTVMLNFKSPEWKAREIAKVRGTIPLQYFGGSQIVKIEKAIDNIQTQEAMMRGGYREPAKLPHPKFNELGLSVTPQHSMEQQGLTMISLAVEGKSATVTDVQVYDADGQPCPGYSGKMDMGQATQYMVTVAGKPKTPLSLAFVVSGDATTVTVPIQLDKIPLTNPAP